MQQQIAVDAFDVAQPRRMAVGTTDLAE